MSFVSRLTQIFTAGLVLAVMAHAATLPDVSVRPQARVVQPIDNQKVTVLANSRPGVLALAVDKGRVAGSTPLSHMSLVLKSTDEQEHALRSLLDEQQDKGSANFHKWMTPESFASAFGVASTDLAKLTAWLQDSGFTVDSVSKGARLIQFSGTAAQVEAAFHTEMHSYNLSGEAHISNATDVAVPAALSYVVAGVGHLNDFEPKPNSVNPRKVVMGSDGQMHPVVPGTNTPDYTTGGGTHYVGPGDVAIIYNAKPLLASGIDGTGVKIGVIGQTTINLSNYQTFRSLFGLPVNDPVVINLASPPAIIADDIESDLDVEWASALATKAGIYFYTASGVDGGVGTSAQQAVDSNQVDIISMSYGGCEQTNAAAGTAFWNNLWEQAAAQGQTAFVSTGDSSATGCASSSAARATGSAAVYGVNALGSSAYNVAVGGTEFNEGTATGVTQYWGTSTTAPYGSALSYIPETVWSEGSFDIVQQSTGVAGGGGGVAMFTARPAWQVGPGIAAADPAGPTFTTTGAIPAGMPHRLVPDLSLIAAGNHDGTIFCSEGVCKIDQNGLPAGFGIVGGTSVATPVMAGVQALINQKNGGRQGNANYYYYKLAAAQTTANCASTLPPAASCNFNDVVTGNNYSPLTTNGYYDFTTQTNHGTLGTDYLGFAAGTGFDEATGLGTPNITNVANNWSTVTFNASKTTLTLNPATATHGTTMNATIAVAAVSGSGTPTGDVSITAIGQSAGTGDGNYYHLTAGSATAALTMLPGGTYSVVAHYTGDSVYGASDSAPVTVTIASEASTTSLGTYSPTTGTAGTAFAYGTGVLAEAQVFGNSATSTNSNGVPNTGAATGNITFTLTSGSTNLTSFTATLDPTSFALFEIAQNFTNFPAFYGVLAPGTYSVTATYPGDSSFKASSGTANFTVTKATVTPTLRAVTAEISSGSQATFNVSLAASGSGVLPTGSVTVTDTTTSTTLGTGTLVNGSAVITTTAITTAGAHSITASYGGDTLYNTANSTAATITVGGSASSLTLGASASTAQVLAPITLTATPPSTATGTVYFYDGSTLLGTATISSSTHVAAASIASLTAGTHNISATYAGNSTLDASTSNTVPLTITQNTPTLSLTSQQANGTGASVDMNAVLTLSPAATSTSGANPAPSAQVQFLDGTTVLGTAPLVFTLNYHYYTAAFNTAALTPGPHTLTAKFPGDTNYAAATSGTQNISIGMTGITVSSSASTAGTTVPLTLTAKVTPNVSSSTAIGGSVTFYDGTTNLGTANVTNGTATLAFAGFTTVGAHTVTAVYSGDNNFYTSTTSAGVTINVTKNDTTTVLTSSTTNVGTGIVFTLTATVTSKTASTAAVSGTVTFLDGTTTIGTASVTSGKATLATATLSGVGTHTVTASYAGDTNYNGSLSTSSVSITTVTPSYTMSANPTSLTIQRGYSGSLTLTATPVGNYTGTIILSCSGQPANSTCSFSPAAITLNGKNTPASSTLTISTFGTYHSGLLWLPAMLLAGVLAFRRKQMTLRGRQLMVLAILMLGTVAVSGCGGGGSFPQTPTGTSTITVTASGTGSTSASPNIAPTVTVSITVQ